MGAEAVNSLAIDENVEKYTMITTKMFDMKADDGSTQKLRVSLGDHTAYSITYMQGTVPQTESEIAISATYAEELTKNIGDEIVLTVDGAEKRLTVSGVYSDITSGGRTAQAIFETNSGDILSVSIPITFRAYTDTEAIIAQYKEQFPFAKVYGVEENINQMFGSIINSILPALRDSKKDTVMLKQRAKALMRKTGIDGLENRDTTEVSGGQLQRAGICRALINAPEILFADEPTGALNSKSAKEIMGLLVDVNREDTSILLVTHDAKIAAHADRILFTKDGNIVLELPLQKIQRRGYGGKNRKGTHADGVCRNLGETENKVVVYK